MARIKSLLVVWPVFLATHAFSEQITIETDDGVHLIRCIKAGGTYAQCEMVFESADEYYDCIAFDPNGKPIATGIGNGGKVNFKDLDYTLIADVKCR